MPRSKPNESSPSIDGASLHALVALARGRPLLTQPASWTALLSLAQRERVLGLGWSRSASIVRAAAPTDVSSRWQQLALTLGLYAQRQLEELARMVGALRKQDIAVVVLKGAPLAQRLYGDYSVRPTLDLDVYVPVEQRSKAARILATVGWRLTSAQWPEEEKFERKVGDHYFVLEVHSSAIDDASLDHIRVPIEWAPLKVGDYELPAHSGALVPAYLASHLLKHHEKPLLWALDITTLWESLNESEKTAALTAASDAGLSKHLDWAVRLAESIIEVADRGPEAAGAIRIIQRALAVRSDFGRVAQLVVLSASPGAALRVIGGRVWPPAWRQGWRAAPSYFTRRAVAWAYRHLVFELPASASQSTVGELALSFDDEDCAPRLMAALRESGAVWVSSIGQSMAPAVPLFGYARIVAMADRMLKIGDVVAIRSSERQCALERVLRLEEDCVLVKPDAPLSKEHRVSRDTVLGICDMVQVGDSRVPIERRPYGNLDMLRAIVRSRFGTRSAVKRLMYVFDYEGAKLSRLESLVEFREAPKDSLGRENLPADAGEERGAVVGLLDGVTVYRASYVRAEANRLRNAPKSWSPRGRILFLHGGTTEPEFRRRGVHSAATRWLLNNERASDVAHAVCFVHADNLAARRTVEGAGFRLVGPVDE